MAMTPARKAKIGGAILLCLLLLILIFQNMEAATSAITIRIFFWEAGLPPILLVPFVFLVGMILGYVLRLRK